MTNQPKDPKPNGGDDVEPDKDALASEQLDTVSGGVKTISWSGSDGDDAMRKAGGNLE